MMPTANSVKANRPAKGRMASAAWLAVWMSVVPFVHVKDYDVPDWGVALVAVILALVVGRVWWKAASRTTAV